MRLSRQATFLLSLEDAFDLGRMTKRHLGNREPAERDASASDEISGRVATKRREDPVVGRCPRHAIRGAIQATLERVTVALLGAALNIPPVDADCRRAREAQSARLVVRLDAPQLDLGVPQATVSTHLGCLGGAAS